MNEKKIAAAVSGVMAYLQAEEEETLTRIQAACESAETKVPPVPLKLWGISGRQTQMQMRTLMQMRAFR